MNNKNLINGEKPEFGNLDHIKALQNSEIVEIKEVPKGHDTIVYVIDGTGKILFIKTFDVDNGGEIERLAAIECYTKVNEHFGWGTISGKEYTKIQIDED